MRGPKPVALELNLAFAGHLPAMLAGWRYQTETLSDGREITTRNSDAAITRNLNAAVAELCERYDIPPEFRPHYHRTAVTRWLHLFEVA